MVMMMASTLKASRRLLGMGSQEFGKEACTGAGGAIEDVETAMSGDGADFVIGVNEDGPHQNDVSAGIGGAGGEEIDAGLNGFVDDLGGFDDGVGGGEDASPLGEEDLLDGILLIVEFGDVAGLDFAARRSRPRAAMLLSG